MSLLRTVFVLTTTSVLLLAGCNKAKPENSTNVDAPKENATSKPAASTFTPEIYWGDHDRAIAFTSEQDLELRENGTNIICKYQRLGGSLRVEIEGTRKEARYFKRVQDGYEDEKGILFASAAALEARGGRRTNRLAPLRQIFTLLRMHGVEHHNQLPATLGEALTAGKIEGVNAGDYDYFGTGKWSKLKPNNVIVSEKLDLKQDDYAVACADGTTRLLSKQEVLDAIPAKQPAPPTTQK